MAPLTGTVALVGPRASEEQEVIRRGPTELRAVSIRVADLMTRAEEAVAATSVAAEVVTTAAEVAVLASYRIWSQVSLRLDPG
jgi:flavin-binding protein dodecin